jgi:peptidoglycan/LPS O-acetylase OafA/YrhL
MSQLPETATRRDGRLTGLDGIRAVAVSLVLVAHFGPRSPDGGVLSAVVERGVFGVEMFFVLSGFLITHLLVREERAGGSIHLPRFYARRSLRILPPLLAYLGALVIAGALGLVSVPTGDYLAGLLFVRNFFGTAPETAHLWSLAIEEQFYLCWPLFLVLVRSERWRVAVCTGLILGLPFWMQLNYRLAGGADRLEHGRTDFRLCPILTGAGLALVLATRAGRRVLTDRRLSGVAVACVAAVVLVAAVFTDALAGRGIRFVRPTVANGCVALLINHVIHHPRSPLTWVLELPPVAWLGRLSYSLYIWQQLFAPNGTSPARFREFPVNLAGAFGFSVFSFYLIERPLLAYRHRFRAGPPAEDPERESDVARVPPGSVT